MSSAALTPPFGHLGGSSPSAHTQVLCRVRKGPEALGPPGDCPQEQSCFSRPPASPPPPAPLTGPPQPQRPVGEEKGSGDCLAFCCLPEKWGGRNSVLGPGSEGRTLREPLLSCQGLWDPWESGPRSPQLSLASQSERRLGLSTWSWSPPCRTLGRAHPDRGAFVLGQPGLGRDLQPGPSDSHRPPQGQWLPGLSQ